ncbi:MAG TPA: tagaturonate epimerase family protein, partial [Opitutales bacterium]|nr:tagaturonate epimerase family protein [Opitutales bacterium]
GHTITSFAPRMLTGWESVVDFRGTRQQVERFMKAHVAVAYYEGPYKVSIHHGDDKFSVLPSLGLICGNLLHFKISGTSFLEGMRVVVRKHPTLFNEIVAFCLENHGMRNYPIPCSLDREAIDELSRTTLKDVEGIFIDQEVGRQLLEGMYAPVFSIGRRPNGIPFKEALTEVIQKHEGLFTGFLTERVGRHVELLSTSA